MLTPTEYFFEFIAYHEKAKKLQTMNIESPTGRDVTVDPGFKDPLMQYVTIYDCVERKYAGFSNAIQQIWCGTNNPKRWQAKDCDYLHDQFAEVTWMWLFLYHRLTGSGASFSQDHGFRNNHVYTLATECNDRYEMVDMAHCLLTSGTPCFTSIGNQIPPFPKPCHPYKRGSELYMVEHSSQLVSEVHLWLVSQPAPVGITKLVDHIEHLHRSWGLKMFHFVLTAWAMDIAEYFPQYVDPHSHVYYGKNALEAFDLMFAGFKKKLANEAMEMLMDVTGNMSPMSLEDVACDTIRYLERYVPKGYEHLEPWQVEHRPLFVNDHPKTHPSYYKVIGR